MPAAKKKKFNECLKSVVEQQFNFALGKMFDKIYFLENTNNSF
jgi:hypothetical protein